MSEMKEREKHNYTYPSAILGAGLLMLLRICDKASVFSVVLVLVGLTALVFSMRHARTGREYTFLAGVMAVAFEVRFYGYTGDPAADIPLGLLVGLIMFALMGSECLLKKFVVFFLKNSGDSSRKKFVDSSLKHSVDSSLKHSVDSSLKYFGDSFLYTLIYPAAYLLFMYFTEILKINMPFRMDTYLSCLPVLCQITALFGIYSLDFLLAWTASVLVFVADHRESRRGILVGLIYAAVLVGIICYGMVHMNQRNDAERAKTDTVRVACAVGPYVGTLADSSYTELTMEETLESLTRIVEEAAEEEAEILVFSEEAYGVADREEEVLLEEAEQLAARYDMHLLLAYEVADTDDSEDGKSINKLCWIANDGWVVYDYTKHCLVPLVETAEYVRGNKNIGSFDINVHGRWITVATAICYDADFDLFMSVGEDVDLLLLPTWDWDVIAEEHFSVARLRAIQSETTLVRSVYDGWSAVIDSAGNVLMRENANEIGYENVIVCEVPVG